METKKFTQFGTLSVLIMLPMLIIFTRMMIKSGLKNSGANHVGHPTNANWCATIVVSVASRQKEDEEITMRKYSHQPKRIMWVLASLIYDSIWP